MKVVQSSSTLLLAAIFLPLVTAQIDENCFDGKVCDCKGYLENQQYELLKVKVKCMNEGSSQHHFLPESQDQITRDVCLSYYNLRPQGRLLVCFYKEVGMIVNINGIDQWDLESMRGFFIRTLSEDYQDLDQAGIRLIILTTFHVCPANPIDFPNLPFIECWARGRELIDIVERGTSNDVESLSNDGEQDKGSADDDIHQVSMAKSYERDDSDYKKVTSG